MQIRNYNAYRNLFFQENASDLGTTYHDEKHMAAVLLRDGDNGQLELVKFSSYLYSKLYLDFLFHSFSAYLCNFIKSPKLENLHYNFILYYGNTKQNVVN